jgi:glycosyltransferase involved in cell wall biosynthesis
MRSRYVQFLIECPTPQRVPVLDALHARNSPLAVAYRTHTDGARGWGDIAVGHPFETLPPSTGGAILGAVRLALRRECGGLAAFGYWRPSFVAAILVARLRRLPLAIRSDSNVSKELSRPRAIRFCKRRALHWLLGQNVHIWTIGSANARYWDLYGFRNHTLIPYRVPAPPVGDPEGASRVRSELGITGKIVLFVGRMVPEKGVRDLLSAFLELEGSSDTHLVVVGEGPERAILDEVAAQDPRIHAVGSVPHSTLGDYYMAADVIVVPSRIEPWGLVVNEALANGRRVIASSAVGASEDLLDPTNGRRFRAGSVGGLLESLRSELCESPGQPAPLTEGLDVEAFVKAIANLLGSSGQ